MPKEPENEIDALEKQKGKLMLVTNSPITTQQVLKIFQRTPKQHVHTRPAKGGGTWDYVTATYVKKVLNFVFGFLWSFEIMSEREIGKQVVVRGRLTILDPKTREPMLVKEQYGRADIKTLKAGGNLDIGNDYKSAASDALKKCAAELGVASDIYGKQEFRDIGIDIGGSPDAPKNEAIGIQPQTDQIMKLLRAMKVTPDKDFAAIKKVAKIELKDWRMTETQAKHVLASLLAYKNGKK